MRGSEGFVSVWLYTLLPESKVKLSSLSLGSALIARGKEIAVDLPLPFLFARIQRPFVRSNDVNDILVHRFLGLAIGDILFVGQNSIARP